MAERRDSGSSIQGPRDFAEAFGAAPETIDRLTAYEALLRQWQRTINLVAPSTLEAVWHRHFADSAQLLALAPQARNWIDLGSGAGFPGLVAAMMLAEPMKASVPSPITPRACLRHDSGEGQGGGDAPTSAVAAPPTPNLSPRRVEDAPAARWGGGYALREGGKPKVTLIESNARKCAFLREVARQTGIQASVAVDILSTRIEVAATQASLHGPDVVSARALAPLDKLVGLAAPLFAPSTVGLFLKGRDAAKELEGAQGAWEFDAELVPSRTEPDGRVVVMRRLQRRHAPNK